MCAYVSTSSNTWLHQKYQVYFEIFLIPVRLCSQVNCPFPTVVVHTTSVLLVCTHTLVWPARPIYSPLLFIMLKPQHSKTEGLAGQTSTHVLYTRLLLCPCQSLLYIGAKTTINFETTSMLHMGVRMKVYVQGQPKRSGVNDIVQTTEHPLAFWKLWVAHHRSTAKIHCIIM